MTIKRSEIKQSCIQLSSQLKPIIRPILIHKFNVLLKKMPYSFARSIYRYTISHFSNESGSKYISQNG